MSPLSSAPRRTPLARLRALLVGTAWVVLSLSCTENTAPQRAKGVDRAALEKAKVAAKERKPGDVKLPWLQGSSLNKPQGIKRFGRFIRNNLWDRLQMISESAVEHGDTELLAMGYFYLAFLEARKISTGEANPDDVFAMVKTAVELGYRNPYEISQAKPLLPLLDRPDFQELIQQLEDEFRSSLRKKFEAGVVEELRLSQEVSLDAWKPELKPLDGEQLWAQDKPMLVVASRIHHDGFNKLLPRIQAAHEKYGTDVPMAVVFYQYSGDDAQRLEQTRAYIDNLSEDASVKLPCAVVGRSQFKDLLTLLETRHEKLNALRAAGNTPGGTGAGGKIQPFNPYQPLGLFMTAEGVPLYLSRGVIEDWQLGFILERFAEATAKTSSEETPDTESEPEENQTTPKNSSQ